MSKRPSPTRTINPLPFGDLDPHRFEDLVRNLIYDFKRWRSIEATGRAGNDAGFDVRAWEETGDISNADQDDGETGTHPMDGNLWKIQCKREKQIGPRKINAIIDEGVSEKDPPYGYVLVAPTIFSKQSYDVFRDQLRQRGVMEFHLWGKAELEDMLFLPKNDSILFAFFGISLVSRRRSRATEIKFSINNKNKLLRVLSDGDPRREFYKDVLARDIKDVHYPWSDRYKNFDGSPRWKKYTAVGLHPLGLIVEVAKRYAYIDQKRREWDSVNTLNLLDEPSDDEVKRKDYFEKKQEILSLWRYLPRANRAHLMVKGIVAFEDMLAIDDKGDRLFPFPHVFVDFSARSGPLKYQRPSLTVGQYDIAVDDAYKKVDFFPTVPPPRLDRNVYRDRALELDEHNAHRFKSPHLAKDILDTSGSYAFLKQRDVIRVAGHKPYGSNEEMFIEITHKHQIAASDYVNEHPEQLELVKSQIGRSPSATDKVTVLEFETVYPWELNDERSA